MELHDDVQVAVLTATLRHELEHVRQRQICGSVLFDVDQYADDATIYKAGGLPGSRVFYNLKPTEQDANAAAAMLLAEDFSDGVRATILDSKDAAVARSLIPPETHTRS